MKKLLLVSLILVVFTTAYAQREKVAMFKLRGGLTVPIDYFGKNRGKLDYSGFVKIGSNYGFEAVYFFSENIGFGGLLSYNILKVDNVRLTGAVINSNINYDTAFVKVNPFKTIVGTVGFYFDLPATDYFAFTMKMMIGTHIVQKPEGVITVVDKTGLQFKLEETAIFESQFAIYTGAGIRVNPYDNWNVTVDIEYVGSRFEFEYKKNGVPSISSSVVKNLVLSFGIAYFLEYKN